MTPQIDFTQFGGMYMTQYTLAYMQEAYSKAIDAIAAAYGNKVIVSGLTLAGSTVTNGWVVLDGQLLPVVGGTQLMYLFLEETTDPEQFADGTSKPVYSKKQLKFTSVAAGNYQFTEFVRLPFCTNNLLDGFTNIQAIFSHVFFGENVILNGGIATLAGGVVSITAGKAYMAGRYISFPAYSSSTTTVYLSNTGTWLPTQPAIDFILYDHDTSQHFKDVLKRNQADSGCLVTHTNASELQYFDVATGLGKWRWKGWKIADIMQSRSPIGYDRRTVAGGDNNWDAVNNTVGNQHGSKLKTLDLTNVPPHDHTRNPNGSPMLDMTDGSGVGADVTGGNRYKTASNLKTGMSGGSGGVATPFNITQASTVVLMIERI